MRIVFIGDSITESGKFQDKQRLGSGYVRLIHDYLITSFPASHFVITNKGISGNRIDDLAVRWQEDVVDINPDIVSVSIGVNDVWRQLKYKYRATKQIYPDEFFRIYDDLLQQIRSNTDAKIVLMEPTVIVEDPTSTGNEKLKPYVQIVNDLAEKYDVRLVPTHQGFIKYLEAANGFDLTVDGVHMNSTGNMLMSTLWLEATKDMLFLR